MQASQMWSLAPHGTLSTALAPCSFHRAHQEWSLSIEPVKYTWRLPDVAQEQQNVEVHNMLLAVGTVFKMVKFFMYDRIFCCWKNPYSSLPNSSWPINCSTSYFCRFQIWVKSCTNFLPVFSLFHIIIQVSFHCQKW